MTRIAPPTFASEIFDVTMKGLEAGLKVGDIATYGVECCDVDDDALEVMSRPNLLGFDRIPVRDGDRVAGVLERKPETPAGLARACMRNLDDGLLVASDEPLKRFIPFLVENPYRLVLRGTRVAGIVTSSDVQKLPVRLLAFALVTHLEMTMAEVIVHSATGDEWIRFLGEARELKVMEQFDQLHIENVDPPLIEVTNFCDKRDILARMGHLDFPSKAKAVSTFKQIERLRNSVAHAATYAQTEAKLAEFVELLVQTEEWINRLSQLRHPREQ